MASDELPRIGAPATRALAAIGITRLSHLEGVQLDDLGTLHGVGPRAIELLKDAMNQHRYVCRLCGLGIRPTDHAAWMADEFFHAPCAEPAFEGTPAWQHMKIGDLNQLAQGLGRAAM